MVVMYQEIACQTVTVVTLGVLYRSPTGDEPRSRQAGA